jgi:hypothetical protein
MLFPKIVRDPGERRRPMAMAISGIEIIISCYGGIMSE